MLTTANSASFESSLNGSDTEAKIEVALDESDPDAKDTLTVVKKDSDNIAIEDLTSVAADENDPYVDDSSEYSAYLSIPAAEPDSEGDSVESGYITLDAKKGDTITIVAYAEAAPAIQFAKADDEPASTESVEDISTLADGETTTHIIRLFAKDSDFQTGTDSVTYKISSTSDLAIARIYRGREVELSGSVTGLEKADASAKLTFTPSDEDSDTDAVEATIKTENEASTYTATLKNGVEYTVSIGDCDVTVENATDADAGDKVTAIKDETKNITIEAKAPETVTLGGSIAFKNSEGAALSDTDEAAALNGLGTITFEPVTDDTSDDNSSRSGNSAEGTVTATVNKTAKTYTATLIKGATYKMIVSNETTYNSITVSGISNLNAVTLSANKTDADITFALKPTETIDTDTFVLNAADLKEKNATITTTRVDENVGTNGYFTVYYKNSGNGSSWKEASTEFDDGITLGVGINFGGNGSLDLTQNPPTYTSLVKFTTKEAANVKVYWTSGGSGDRKFIILDSEGKAVAGAETETSPTGGAISDIPLANAGTYYLAPSGGSSNLYQVIVSKGSAGNKTSEYSVSASELKENNATITTTRVDENVGTDGYFTVYYKNSGNGSSWKETSTEFDDGITLGVGINFGGNGSLDLTQNPPTYTSLVKFTTKEAANVKVYWTSGGSGDRKFIILDSEGKAVAGAETETSPTGGAISDIPLANAGTYYLAPSGGSSNLYKVVVTEGNSGSTEDPEPDRTAWGEVKDPVIELVTVDENDPTQVSVKVTADVSDAGADKVAVKMYDSAGKVVDTKERKVKEPEHTLKFTLSATGSYTFEAELSRESEVTIKKSGKTSDAVTYVLPLGVPTIIEAVNAGKVEGSNPESGSVDFSWTAVKEATSYRIKVTEKSEESNEDDTSALAETTVVNTTTAATSITIKESLEIGKTYTFSVAARRAGTGANGRTEESDEFATTDVTITEEGVAPPGKGIYVVDTKDIGANTTGDVSKSGVEKAGTDRFFTFLYGSSSKTQKDSRSFDDEEYSQSVGRLSFGGEITEGSVPSQNAIKFTVTGSAKVAVYWHTANAGREVQLLDGEGNLVGASSGSATGTSYIQTFFIDNAGTYYIGGQTGNVYFYRVKVWNEYEIQSRPEWSGVAKPSITKVAFAKKEVDKVKVDDPTTLSLTVTADIGPEASADKVTVNMLDEDGNVVASGISSAAKTEHTIEITPSASGKYTFVASLSRDGENTTIDSDPYPTDAPYEFKLPLSDVIIKNTVDRGALADDATHGSVELIWTAVSEATSYLVKVTEKGSTTAVYEDEVDGDKTKVLVNEGLEIGKEYTFSLTARRGVKDEEGNYVETPEASATATRNHTVGAEAVDIVWSYATYGASISTTNNGHQKLEDGSVRVYSTGGSGKIVPKSTDGVAFYYTEIDPTTTNFKLSADLHVNTWTMSNGQDGFGLMASDRVGVDGDGDDFWTNSYMAVATKTEYHWDSENNKLSNVGDKVELKLGLESLARTGVTADNLKQFNDKNTVAAATNTYFKTTSTPLDTQVHDGSYNNLIANASNDSTLTTIENPIEDLRLQIELTNTGYFITYTELTKDSTGKLVEGKSTTNKYYDRHALSQIIEHSAYVGLFAARNADITFSNIRFTTSEYDPDGEVETRPVEYYDPQFTVSSASTSNSADYSLIYETNWKGTLIVKDEAGKVYTEEISATPEVSGKAKIDVKLNVGNNNFTLTFDPDKDFDPNNGEPITKLTNYDSNTRTFSVVYKNYGKEGEALYVSSKGKATGNGTKTNPLDIYTAVKYAQPGQTIYLMEGRYNLTSTVRIERGVDGTADKPISMLPDPEAKGERPVVFDFKGACAGMIFAGDHWYFRGFDVTGSADGKDGIKVSGSYNTLDQIHAYKNGNTGIQISRLLGSDLWDDWPSHNLILNCTSYLNADGGYEDADGFACKLTTADGNVFDGCVAAYNADDGWDLFAKVETGSIGTVVIRNCIAYKNGYVLRADNGNGELAWYDEVEDPTTIKEVVAGNGNGFKMGGSSLKGGHTLINSLTFYNRAKGIDCNSCPDIVVRDSITYNNESYNVAFYTGAATSDYDAEGIISYRTEGLMIPVTDKGGNVELKDAAKEVSERIGQNSNLITACQTYLNKIYNDSNYYWDPTVEKSQNNSGVTVTDSWFVENGLNFDNWFTAYAKGLDGSTKVVDRNPDQTINMHDFLKLSSSASTDMSGSGMGAGSPSIDENDENYPKPDDPSGEIVKGDAADESEAGGVSSDDADKMPADAGTLVNNGILWYTIVDEEEIEYTGKAVKPEVHVYDGTTLLKAGKDYSVSYRNNVNAYVEELSGTVEAYKTAKSRKKIPTIIIRGKGNYISNSKINTDIAFDINPVVLSNDDMNRIGANDIVVITDKKGTQKITPVVTFNGRKLAKTRDFIYTESTYAAGDENKADKQSITVTGTGNFIGSKDITIRYTTNAQYKTNSVSKFKVEKIVDQYRQGYTNIVNGMGGDPIPVEPAIKVTNPSSLKQYIEGGTEDKENCHYVVTYRNNIEIGTATAIITGINGYYGTKEVKFRIIAPPLGTLYKQGNAKFINTANITVDANGKISGTPTEFAFNTTYSYTGQAVEKEYMADLGVAVKQLDGNWYMLTEGKDYVLAPRNTNRAGSASIVVKGIGNYKATMASKSFKITAFEINKSENASKLGGTFALDSNGQPTMFASYSNGVYTNLQVTVPYEKSGSKPTVSLRVNGHLMKAGKDYTVTYRNFAKVTAAGADARRMPTIVVTGRGGLKGRITATYTISAKELNASENQIKVEAQDVGISSKSGSGYTGNYTTRLVVKDAKGKVLRAGADYDKQNVKYELVNNETLRPLGEEEKYYEHRNLGNGIGNKRLGFAISDSEYLTVKVTIKPTANGLYSANSNAEIYGYYKISYSKNLLRSTTAKINYGKDSLTGKNKTYFDYTGSAINLDDTTLTLTMKGVTEPLKLNDDYSVVSYSKNDRKGTATLIIKGEGKYIGTKVIKFRIGSKVLKWWEK